MECIAVINQKGGVGKTATATNLGAGLAQLGKRVLLIDMDPQGHLSTHLGLDSKATGSGAYELLTRDLALEKAIHRADELIDVIPSQIDLAAAEVELVSVVGREVILRDHLVRLEAAYDYALVDCPPSLGILTLNALTAATRVLIPLQPHFLALQGVGKLFETISLVSARLNPRLTVAGMVICMYESGTKLGGEVIADLRSFLESSRGGVSPWKDARIFVSKIRRNVKLAECPSYGQSIFDYAPKSHGAEDYLALAEELVAVLEPAPAPTPAPAPVVVATPPVSVVERCGSAPVVRQPRTKKVVKSPPVEVEVQETVPVSVPIDATPEPVMP
ncbi:MAG: AAA family ATPase [Planctomycetota bacterium]